MEYELRLMLLRHWTLEDSIQNSNYVISKLGLTKDKDKNRYKEFLSKLGVPLEEAKQKFNYMNADLKKTLKRRIQDKSHLFNLDNILISSYVY